jgi:hypothetical protein
LSIVMSTPGRSSAAKPKLSSIQSSTRRSLMRIVAPSSPSASTASSEATISSASARDESSPMMSMSHWTNWR